MSASLRDKLAAIRDQLFPRTSNRLGCWKKKRYPDEREVSAVRLLRGRAESAPLYHYQCPECNGWHLTKLKPEGWNHK